MKAPRPIVYTPTGRAGEYSNHGFAANLFKGCTNGCAYCYVPNRFNKRESFNASVVPAPDVLARLEYDLTKRKGIPHPLPEPLFLCFTCDPCPQNYDLVREITLPAINIIHRSGNRVRLLTKGCSWNVTAALVAGDEYGVTLTVTDQESHDAWEPNAPGWGIRLMGLCDARSYGITTWASFEPVIDPEQTLELIEQAAPSLTYCKIGKFNHGIDTAWPSPEWKARVESIDWSDFTNKAARLCDKLGLPRYIKHDLRPYLELGVCPDTLEVQP